MRKIRISLYVIIASCLIFTGCVSASFKHEMENAARAGDFDSALDVIKKNEDRSPYKNKNRLLFCLDYGLMCHYCGDFETSNLYLEEAETLIEQLNAVSVSREIGSYLLNDNIREYSGEDYESLYVNIFRCLNYIGLGMRDDALVEIRKANLKLELLENKYRKQVADYNQSEDALVEVPQVKNHFHNSALSRYLGTVLFRQDHSYDDARIEAQWLEKAFAEQSSIYDFPVPEIPRQKFPSGDSALLDVMAFSGMGPVKEPLGFLVTVGGGLLTFSATGYDSDFVSSLLGFFILPCPGVWHTSVMNFQIPILAQRDRTPDSIVVSLTGEDGTRVTMDLLENVNSIAKDTYKLKLPLTVVKTALRVIGKKIGSEAGQYAIREASGDNSLAAISGLLFDVLSAVSENVDVRSCAMLPAYVYTAELEVKPGVYDVTVDYYQNGSLINSDVRSGVNIEKDRLNFLESVNFRSIR
ncbi:MAG: hypothetical protein MJ215_02560 [Spirochaetia bacterium]|nr:hypothetical protein [Spirochaetia bacterium]